MTSVRLPAEIESKLQSISMSKHKSKTELIIQALEMMFLREESEQDSFEIGQNSFGKFGSGKGDLSTNYKSLIKEKIRAKTSSH